jgi:hypothetical protein
MIKKISDIIALIIAIIFVYLAIYLHFVLHRMPFQLAIFIILFFGIGAVVQIISLTTKHEGWIVRPEDMTKKQLIITDIGCIIFGVCSLAGIFLFNLPIIFKIILIFGFFFFFFGGIILLVKQLRKKEKTTGTV